MATKRAMQAEQTRQNLLETGKRLLNEKGADAITVDEIVEACGVAKGTFYHYFQSKDEFISHVAYGPFVSLDNDIATVTGPHAESLRRYIVDWLRAISMYSPHYLAGWLSHVDRYAQLNADGARVGLQDDFAHARVASIAQLLDRAVEEGLLTRACPTQDIANLVGTLLFGSTVWWCISDGTMDMDDWAFRQADLIITLIERYQVS